MAKWKTAVQMTAIGCLISINIIPDLAVIISTAGITLLWFAAFMTAMTGLSYFKAGISSL
jgi:phosphatidylglycerophosphate synthase